MLVGDAQGSGARPERLSLEPLGGSVNERDPEIVLFDLGDRLRPKRHRAAALRSTIRSACDSASRRSEPSALATCCDPAAPTTSMTRLRDVLRLRVDHEPTSLPSSRSSERANAQPSKAQAANFGAESRGDTVDDSWSAPAVSWSKSGTSARAQNTGRFLALATGQCLTVGFRFHIRSSSAGRISGSSAAESADFWRSSR